MKKQMVKIFHIIFQIATFLKRGVYIYLGPAFPLLKLTPNGFSLSHANTRRKRIFKFLKMFENSFYLPDL